MEFIFILKNSYLVITDSGGIQEEASSLGKPFVILRNSTERPEVLSNQNGYLVGNNPSKIIEAVNSLLKNKDLYLSMSKKNNAFGDGNTSELVLLKTRDFL